MAAPLRNKMLSINASGKICCLAVRSARGGILSIPVKGITVRQFSQLHKCARWQTTLNRSDCRKWALSAVRLASTDVKEGIPAPPEVPSGFIPESPMLPEDVIPNLPDLNALGEPTLHSLGLGSNWPVGLFQKLVEFMHVHADVPWWTAIVASVMCIRMLIFPVMVKQQKTLAKFEKHRPKMTKLQNAYDEAKMSQDPLEIMKKSQELSLFMKDKKMNVMYLAAPIFVQMPIFLSVFMGLRKMSDLPVESLKTGGIGWVTDLTVSDPFFILPTLSALALLVNFEIGAESQRASTMSHGQRWLLRGSSGIFLIVMSFTPAATCMYFATSNTMTLLQAQLLRNPKVRNFFKIPERPKPEDVKTEGNKGFVEGFQGMFDKRRQQKEIINRRLTDEERFKKAGTGPVPKTYAYNPKAVKAAV